MRIVWAVIAGFWLLASLTGYYGLFSGEATIDFNYVVVGLIMPSVMTVSCVADYVVEGRKQRQKQERND